jgi:hypothetical protein
VAHISGDPTEAAPVQAQIETAAGLRQRLKEAEVREAINDVCATLHHLGTDSQTQDVKLGPTPRAKVGIDGQETMALLDTGSPVTIVSLEYLLQVLCLTQKPGVTPEEWRSMTENRLQPTTLTLRNYGGDQLNIVRQILVNLTC